jgi:hypothetical protein
MPTPDHACSTIASVHSSSRRPSLMSKRRRTRCRRRALPSFDARGESARSARPCLPSRVAPDASRADARLARPFDGGSRRRAPARPHPFDPHVRDALPDLGRPAGSRARRPVGTTGSTGPARAPPPRHPARPRMHRGRGPAARGPAPDRRDGLRGRRAAAILPGAAPGPGAGCGMTGPPSSSGLGFRPFKAATRVRIPLGAHNRIAHAPVEESGRPHRPVKAEIAGSKPVGRAGRWRRARARRQKSV